MSDVEQPARRSSRIGFHEAVKGRTQTMESVEFARRRDKRRQRNKLAKASRKKNR